MPEIYHVAFHITEGGAHSQTPNKSTLVDWHRRHGGRRLIGDIITPTACPIWSMPKGEEMPSNCLCVFVGAIPFSKETEELHLRQPTSSECMSDIEKDHEQFPDWWKMTTRHNWCWICYHLTSYSNCDPALSKPWPWLWKSRMTGRQKERESESKK